MALSPAEVWCGKDRKRELCGFAIGCFTNLYMKVARLVRSGRNLMSEICRKVPLKNRSRKDVMVLGALSGY